MPGCYVVDIILKIAQLSLSRYIQAATSPKDVVIVVDVSGSMKGLRLTIAKHTINTILDTLGENDFVNIIAVSTHTQLLLNKCNTMQNQTQIHTPNIQLPPGIYFQ